MVASALRLLPCPMRDGKALGDLVTTDGAEAVCSSEGRTRGEGVEGGF